MRNQLKFMAVLSAAAIMAAAAPTSTYLTTAFAADRPVEGWIEDEGVWYFYDEDGYEVTDTWKKTNDTWFYLDSDGAMTLNAKVDDFYVGSDGKMVTNQWVTIRNEEEEDSPEAPEAHYYYFGKDGKAVASKWASINDKWFYFNEEGQMQTGKLEIDGATYYLGAENDGAMRTGWVKLEENAANPEVTDNWYYFDSNGKMVANQTDKKINGNYYTFVDGIMQTGWFKMPAAVTETDATASNAEAAAEKPAKIADYQYYSEDGMRAAGWLKIEGVEGINDVDETYSFYFKNGKPYSAEKGIQLFTIDSKRYGFNEKGEMQTGLKVVNLENDQIAHYYFGNDGVMKTGKQTIYSETLGENQSWFFYTDGSRKGQGYHGLKDNNVYVYGLRQDADQDLRYAPATVNDTKYLVNASGAIQKASSSSTSAVKPELGKGFKDFQDYNNTTWVVDSNGIIQ